MSYLDLTEEDLTAAKRKIDAPRTLLGQWVLPLEHKSNISVPRLLLEMMLLEAVTSPQSYKLTVVFYCFAAILPASGVYSIISLFVSGLLLNVFRPILQENASAVPYNGGSYSYLVNFTTKTIAVVAAAITALDAITTVPRNPEYANSRLLFQLAVLVGILPGKSVYHSLTHF
jgi:hypothetical protein